MKSCIVEIETERYLDQSAEQFAQLIQDKCADIADERVGQACYLADATDYQLFFYDLALVFDATSNDQRLFRLALLRDKIADRIKNSDVVRQLAISRLEDE